ncbi:MAG: EexN family lipoprotein [Woeseia sp.]
MKRITIAICALGVLAACGEEPPPRSVAEFLEDPILLDATMVRCGQDRDATRYDAECVNARSAVDQLAAAAEQARRQQLEAQSDRKRQALRRAQEAAAEARRLSLEAAQRREEAAYLGVFEPLPADGGQPATVGPAEPVDSASTELATEIPASAAAAAPGAAASPVGQELQNDLPAELPDEMDEAAEPRADLEEADLDSVREELKRRHDEGQQ